MIKIKTNTGKNQYKKKSKDYSKYDACFKIAGLEICSENKIRESIIKNLFKNTVAVAVLLLIHKRCFYRILLTNFGKKMFQRAS